MSDNDQAQSDGRKDNAAQAKGLGTSQVTPDDYPPAERDDTVERTGRVEGVVGESRGIVNRTGNPAPRQGAGDGSSRGSAGDPAEGQR